MDFSDVFLISVASPLLIASFAWALASIIGKLRCYALPIVPWVAPILSVLTLLAFSIGWFSVISELPAEGLLREVLSWGGLVMLMFLIFRVIEAIRGFPYRKRVQGT